MRMGDKVETRVSAVSSGSLAIDDALGVGGLPRGRIVEIYGPESSGKTTVALHAVAMVQQHGGTAAYIDAENAMDPKYAAALGVNIDELLLSQPDTGEQGLEIADELVASGAIDILVVDSVAALVPRAEIEGDMGDAHVGLQARLMSQALRKLSGAINKTKTIALFINQIREKVGISQSGELVDMAVEKDLIEKAGSWYAYQGERIGQGREHAKSYLETHEELRRTIEKQVRLAYGMSPDHVIDQADIETDTTTSAAS